MNRGGIDGRKAVINSSVGRIPTTPLLEKLADYETYLHTQNSLMNRIIGLSGLIINAVLLSACLFLVPASQTSTRSPPSEAQVTGTSVPQIASPIPSKIAPGPTLDGCPMFPEDNIWNVRVDTLPVHAHSDDYVDTIGRETGLHMDFGSGTWEGGPIGIPYDVVSSDQLETMVQFYYPEESDPGPYPIPENPRIEWGSDHHILIIEKDNCVLYEIYDANLSGSRWSAGSGAIWDLTSNALRPAGWTSADAAGLPMLPGLARYDEVNAGEIRHALRFTTHITNGYVWPARHLTSNEVDPAIPPMGQRFRLKASFDTSPFPPELQVILRAMQSYGIILADEGADWYINGAPDERWDNEMLHMLDIITGDDFEAVDVSGLMVDPNSGQAVLP